MADAVRPQSAAVLDPISPTVDNGASSFVDRVYHVMEAALAD